MLPETEQKTKKRANKNGKLFNLLPPGVIKIIHKINGGSSIGEIHHYREATKQQQKPNPTHTHAQVLVPIIFIWTLDTVSTNTVKMVQQKNSHVGDGTNVLEHK